MFINLSSDQIANATLSQMGYKVTPIPTSAKEEADFIIELNNITALVEAKKKLDGDNPEERSKTLLSGEPFVSKKISIKNNGTLSGITRKASHQLISSSDKEHDYKLIFFVATGRNAKAVSDQFISTIYGSTDIIKYGEKNPISKKCYYFRNSEFYRRKVIDAAIVGYESRNNLSFQLCINSYSDDYESIKNSDFIIPFGEAVIDPINLEKQGESYLPDAEVERGENKVFETLRTLNPMLNHLAEKYQTGPLVNIDFDVHNITVLVKDE